VIIEINVRITNEPGDSSQYWGTGGINFSESAQLSGTGFETVSKVFTQCHDLLAVLKAEHANTKAKK
jgi:hypothetical protein